MALALAGAVLAARSPSPSAPATAVPGAGVPVAEPATTAGGRLTPRVLALAVGAAVGIGVVLALLQQGAQAEGSSGLTATAAARTVSVVVTLVAVAVLRTETGLPAERRSAVLAVGVADTGANALFAVASTAGEDALVAVLASLYPVVTVLLARAVLGERISRLQGAGVAVALVGVALASIS
jgi:drug/metabolite transporter (DMT)-like permease